MITTNIFLYALPDSLWKKNTNWGNSHLEIGAFVDDALGMEKRIAKGVNQENERSRYTLCCNQLEESIRTLSSISATQVESFRSALQNFQLPFIRLSSQYLDVISQMYLRYPNESANNRLGASFFPLEMIEPHINAFITSASELGIADQVDVKQRISFYKIALSFQCGVIEIQDPFYFKNEGNENNHSIEFFNQGKEEIHTRQLTSPQEDEHYENEDENISVTIRRKAYDILYEQIENAIYMSKEGKNGAVNFSNQPHNVITEALNVFVYSESGKVQKPIYIRVNYTDGSQGKSFPLLCLPKRTEEELNIIQQSLPLRAALLSMRHLSMDQDVDMAWFRNREVSKARAFGETDQFCYEHTKKLLVQSRDEGILKLFLYQTGLQPAVIGFYRALTEELLFRSNNPPSLEVTPNFYISKSGYRQGRSWN